MHTNHEELDLDAHDRQHYQAMHRALEAQRWPEARRAYRELIEPTTQALARGAIRRAPCDDPSERYYRFLLNTCTWDEGSATTQALIARAHR